MAFYFSNKLKLNIEDEEYTIDISNKEVINAVQEITQYAIEMTKKNEPTEGDVMDFIEYNKTFVNNVLGQDALSVLFKDKVISFEDIGELTNYILDEIGKFKNSRITKYSAPSELN